MQALAQPLQPHRRLVQAQTTQTLPPRRRGGEPQRQAKQRLLKEGERDLVEVAVFQGRRAQDQRHFSLPREFSRLGSRP